MLKKSFRKILPLCIALVIVFSGIQTVFASYESEPNDNFDNANDIYSGSPMSGSSYVGDPDYTCLLLTIMMMVTFQLVFVVVLM
jgi:hypothetical protein